MEHNTIVAAGVLFYSLNSNRRLFLLRASKKHKGTWGLVGGKIENGETLLEGLLRETTEEIGCVPPFLKILPVEKFTSADDRFEFHTFICITPTEFVPVLNEEHLGYAWIDAGVWPSPLHPGLWTTISMREVQSKINHVEKSIQMSQ